MTTSARAADLFRRVDAIEYGWCLRFNRSCSRPQVRQLFVIISRLGDGTFWYVLMLALPLIHGDAAWMPVLRMAIVGFLGLALYKYLKSRLVRERPYIALAGIVPGTRPLDRYSFPSGHTLHAVSFTVLITASYPELGLLCVPFAVLVAMSRVVLGLHYPSDVAVGAVLGAILAMASMFLMPI